MMTNKYCMFTYFTNNLSGINEPVSFAFIYDQTKIFNEHACAFITYILRVIVLAFINRNAQFKLMSLS